MADQFYGNSGAGSGTKEIVSESKQSGSGTSVLKTVSVEDNKVHNFEITATVDGEDSSGNDYGAVWNKEVKLHKRNGSLVTNKQTSVFDEIGQDNFSDSDFSLVDNGGDLDLQVDSVQTSYRVQSFDISGITNDPADKSVTTVVTDDSDDSVYYIYSDGTNNEIKEKNLSTGTLSTAALTSADNTGESLLDAAIDSNGDIHLVYRDTNNDLIYVKKASGSWGAVETVTTTKPSGISIDLDGSDIPYVSFLDEDNKATNYADRSGGSWSTEQVKDTQYTANLSNIFVDTSSNIGIVFTESGNNQTTIAIGSSGSWTTLQGTSTEFHASQVLYDGTDWYVSGIVQGGSSFEVSKGGTGGFTVVDSTSTGEVEGDEENLIMGQDSNNNIYFLAAGDDNGSDPWDAVLWELSSSTLSKVKVLDTLGQDWSAHADGGRLSCTDTGGTGGDQKAISFDLNNQRYSATYDWNIVVDKNAVATPVPTGGLEDAWVLFDIATSSISVVEKSSNIDSVNYTNTGVYTVNFSNSASNYWYCLDGIVNETGTTEQSYYISCSESSISSIEVHAFNGTTLSDPSNLIFAAFKKR